jgi:hypothetical protein
MCSELTCPRIHTDPASQASCPRTCAYVARGCARSHRPPSGEGTSTKQTVALSSVIIIVGSVVIGVVFIGLCVLLGVCIVRRMRRAEPPRDGAEMTTTRESRSERSSSTAQSSASLPSSTTTQDSASPLMSGMRSAGNAYDSAPPSAAVIPAASSEELSDNSSDNSSTPTTLPVTTNSPDSGGSTIRTNKPWYIKASDVTLGKKLGEGAFGIVWKGKWHGKHVAVKQLKLDNGTSGAAHAKATTEFANEIGRMASMQPHENLVLLYGVTELEGGDMAAVVEYCAHGSCLDALYGAAPRKWRMDELISIAHGAACGLAHLHRLGVIHRDIAARNVLLTRHDVAKVADFGIRHGARSRNG